MTPQEMDPHLAVNVQESLVKAWAMQQVAYGRVGGSECSSACMGPFEGGPIIFITSTMIWYQIKQQGENTVLSIKKNG